MVTSRVKQALERARNLAGEVTGSIVQGGDSTAWTQGRVVTDARAPRAGGRSDQLSRVLEIQADGIAVIPQADARITFTGATTTWIVTAADPVAPGGTVVAWRLSLIDLVVRGE